MKGRPGADVGDVGLPLHEHLGAAKVAQLELVRLCVDQQVLGLDIPMAHLHAVNVRQRPTHLHTPHTDGQSLTGNGHEVRCAVFFEGRLAQCGACHLFATSASVRLH